MCGVCWVDMGGTPLSLSTDELLQIRCVVGKIRCMARRKVNTPQAVLYRASSVADPIPAVTWLNCTSLSCHVMRLQAAAHPRVQRTVCG
jgi:hypothetical protein